MLLCLGTWQSTYVHQVKIHLCFFRQLSMQTFNARSQPPNPHNGDCKTKSNHLQQKKNSALYKEHFRIRKLADLFHIFPRSYRILRIYESILKENFLQPTYINESARSALEGCEHIAHLDICGRDIGQAKSENAENSQQMALKGYEHIAQ
jgi:hypothetical protein